MREVPVRHLLNLQGLGTLRGLAAVSVTRCGLRQIPAWILELPRLRSLDLSGNQLLAAPHAIVRLAGLRRLSLAGTPLDALQKALAHMRELRHLDVSGTRIRALQRWLPDLLRLEVLDVSGCPLEDLPIDALLAMPRLRVLRVSGGLREPAVELARRAREEQGRQHRACARL
jgi:Leucine-rich repeat (LRR) protein